MQSIISLLTTAILLLQLVSTNPNLPQSFKDTANVIAQNAISQATGALQNQNFGSVGVFNPTIPTPTPILGSTATAPMAASSASSDPQCIAHPILSDFKANKQYVTDDYPILSLEFTAHYQTGCTLDVTTPWSFSSAPSHDGEPPVKGELDKSPWMFNSWDLQGPEVVLGQIPTYTSGSFYGQLNHVLSTTTVFTLKVGDLIVTTTVEKR